MDIKTFDNVLSNVEHELFDVRSERLLLAILMARPDWIVNVQSLVPVEWFNWEAGRAIYQCMLGLHWLSMQNGWPLNCHPDMLDQAAKFLSADKQFMEATKNGEATRHVHSIVPTVNPDTQVLQAIHFVRHAAMRVAAFRQASKLQSLILKSPADDGAHASTSLISGLSSIMTGIQTSSGGPQQMGEAVVDLSGQKMVGIKPTFLPFFASLTGGQKGGRFSVISARTGVGKSVLMGAIARDAAEQGFPAMILDYEMILVEVATRTLSALARVDERLITDGHCMQDSELMAKVQDAIARMKTLNLAHLNVAGFSFDQVLSAIRQFKASVINNHPTQQGLVVVDYLKAPASGNEKEYQLLGTMATQLKELTIELNIPILAAVQENRAAMSMSQAEYTDESLGVIGGSDRISHLCDLVCSLRDLRDFEKRNVESRLPLREDHIIDDNRMCFNQVLHIGKQRGGSSFKQGIPLYYRRGQARYEEMAWEIGSDGQIVMEDGRPKKTEAMTYLHSREFLRKGTGQGLQKKVLD